MLIKSTKIFIKSLARSYSVRVRFAPSPTGKLHIGGLRTAFYNYLFARKNSGEFILRLEDTDQDRLKPGSLENIVQGLKWVGIEADYGPHVNRVDDLKQGGPWSQSKRLDLYHKHADDLISQGKAYYCFCDEARIEILRRNAAKRLEPLKYDGRCTHLTTDKVKEYLKEQRPYVIRFKVDDKDVSYLDMTNGLHKSNPGRQEGDFIIIKSDKFPTYHFANVVDDHHMRITHVLRGQEWQISTAKHILLYEAFGWKHPNYAHLPLILNMDGTKLSKRQGDMDVLSFKRRGYLRETLLAYLSSIGGGVKINFLEDTKLSAVSANQNKDFLSLLIENFDETLMNARPVKLNQSLLDNLNRRFIAIKLKSTNPNDKQDLLTELRELVQEKYPTVNEHYLTDAYLTSVLIWSNDRITKLCDLTSDESGMSYLWQDFANFDFKQYNDVEFISKFISILTDSLQQADAKQFEQVDSIKSELKRAFKGIEGKKKDSSNWKLARLVLTGRLEGPPVAELIQLLGKSVVLYRLNVAYKFCESYINKKSI